MNQIKKNQKTKKINQKIKIKQHSQKIKKVKKEEKKNEINLLIEIKSRKDYSEYFISKNFEKEENEEYREYEENEENSFEENKQYTKDNVEIYIDNIKQEFTRKIDAKKFPEEREYHVKLKFKILFTNCSKMFLECYNITSIDLTNFNTSKVTNMQRMFESCCFTNIDLSNFNTSNVTNMQSMFAESDITSIDLSN